MKDIVGAIKAEAEYINNIMLRENQDIYKCLRPYGYDDLEKFYLDKHEYYIKKYTLTIRDDDIVGIDDKCKNALRSKESVFWIPTISVVSAYVGTDPFDYELAKKLNVNVLKSPHQGGTIICSPGDLSICIHFPKVDDRNYYEYMIKKLKLYLDPFNIYLDKNDFMYNDKKVIGCAEYQSDVMNAFFMDVSFINNSDIVEKLCPKHSEKQPGHIPEKVLSKDRLLQEVLSWVDTSI